jgi:hypothetical protein
MEMIRKNLFDTTTAIAVNSNTSTVENLFLRDIRFQYASSGFNDDNTTSTMVISFDETVSVSRIGLVGMNLKAFTIFYDGVTANTFSLTSTAHTNTSDFTSNSDTSMYLRATPVNCTSVSIDMKSTIVANNDKAIGYLAVSNLLSNFDSNNPRAQLYNPLFTPKEVVHELSDGSYRSQVVDRKYGTKLGLENINSTVRDSLKSVFDSHDDFIFVPFGTSTGWDEIIFPCIWRGPFQFYKYTDNAKNAGHSGNITLLETRV